MHNKGNPRVMHVGGNILAAAEESIIDEYWCHLDNQSTFNAFINDNYLSNTRDAFDVKYLHVHCNTAVTYKKILVDSLDSQILSIITQRGYLTSCHSD